MWKKGSNSRIRMISTVGSQIRLITSKIKTSSKLRSDCSKWRFKLFVFVNHSISRVISLNNLEWPQMANIYICNKTNGNDLKYPSICPKWSKMPKMEIFGHFWNWKFWWKMFPSRKNDRNSNPIFRWILGHLTAVTPPLNRIKSDKLESIWNKIIILMMPMLVTKNSRRHHKISIAIRYQYSQMPLRNILFPD